MSPHNVNNFVSDLVEMAKAMERVPQLERELADARHVLAEMDKQADGLRSDIDQAKAYASTLEQKVHDLEVAKDQAETMFLEADDRFNRTLDFVKTAFGSAGALIQAVEVKAEPGKSEANPIPSSAIMEHNGNSDTVNASPVPDTTQGQSESPLPLSNTTAHIQDSINSSEDANSSVSDAASSLTESTDLGHGNPQGQSDPLPSPAPSPTDPDASTPFADGPDDAKSSIDDVGYHNEPQWHEYGHSEWQERMDRKYGMGNWPRRVENNFYRS